MFRWLELGILRLDFCIDLNQWEGQAESVVISWFANSILFILSADLNLHFSRKVELQFPKEPKSRDLSISDL